MTNPELLAIYKVGLSESLVGGLRAVWNAGWYEGKGITPASGCTDASIIAAKPVAVVTPKKK